MEDYEKLSTEQKFARAMLKLRELHPFYAAIYDVMERVRNDDIGTMGVGTKDIVYSEEFVSKLNFGTFMFVNLHEIGHVALMHVARKQNRDATLWNIACDLYVNKLVCEEFGIKPGRISYSRLVECPLGVLYSDKLDLDSDYAEQIYDSLYAQGMANGFFVDKGSDKAFPFHFKGCSANLKHSYGKDLLDNGDSQETLEDEAKKVLLDATTKSQMAGKSPGMLERLVETLLVPNVRWEPLLRHFLLKVTSKETSFSTPDRRMLYQGAIYPGTGAINSNELSGIKVCIDTSGSRSDDQLAYAFGQIAQLLKEFKVKAELIYWDAAIQSKGDFDSYETFKKIKCKGNGGTTPEVLFEYFNSKECKVKPMLTLIFTDGYFDTEVLKKYSLKYKNTIWILSEGIKEFDAPFGKVACL